MNWTPLNWMSFSPHHPVCRSRTKTANATDSVHVWTILLCCIIIMRGRVRFDTGQFLRAQRITPNPHLASPRHWLTYHMETETLHKDKGCYCVMVSHGIWLDHLLPWLLLPTKSHYSILLSIQHSSNYPDPDMPLKAFFAAQCPPHSFTELLWMWMTNQVQATHTSVFCLYVLPTALFDW